MSETQKPFVKGDRVMNTGNRDRKTIGIITQVIDDQWCEVMWSSDRDGLISGWNGRIRRDGSTDYGYDITNHQFDRIVRVKLSVTIPQEV